MSLVVVGSVAYDAVETPFGKRDRMLGGACTYIALSASYFTEVGIVAVIGEDFDQADCRFLASRGVDLAAWSESRQDVLLVRVYSEDMNDRTTLATDLNVFAEFDPKLPDAYRSKPYLMLGNIQPALQKNVRAQMTSLRAAGGDTMNYWIAITARSARHDSRMDFLLINDGEPGCSPGTRISGGRRMRSSTWAADAGDQAGRIRRDALPARQSLHGSGLPAREGLRPHRRGRLLRGGFAGYLAQQASTSRTRRSTRASSAARDLRLRDGSFCCEQFGVERFALSRGRRSTPASANSRLAPISKAIEWAREVQCAFAGSRESGRPAPECGSRCRRRSPSWLP